jgi:hypothetical protein
MCFSMSLFTVTESLAIDSEHYNVIKHQWLFLSWVCGRSPAVIVGSNPTGSTGVYCECCVVSGRGLCDVLITRP